MLGCGQRILHRGQIRGRVCHLLPSNPADPRGRNHRLIVGPNDWLTLRINERLLCAEAGLAQPTGKSIPAPAE